MSAVDRRSRDAVPKGSEGKPSDRGLRVALVGGDREAAALLELLARVSTARVVAVAHLDAEAPVLALARAYGIPIISSHRKIFEYEPDVVVDASGAADVFEELERTKPVHIEVVGARSAELFRKIIGLHIRDAQQLEKGETVRRITGGVYHSLNNLFTTLLGRASLLLNGVKDERSLPAEVRGGLEVIVRTLGRGADILKRIRSLMGDAEGKPVTRMDVREIVRDVTALADPLIREGEARSASIEVRLELDEVPPVVGRASELLEVLLNLIVNAIEAMPEGGVLTIQTASDGADVFLRVRDTGSGIPDAVQAKLFTPFFTTKSGGTGLGLNVSRETIRRHGGDVTVESMAGRGTCVTVRFPAEIRAAALRGWRVLVADDDPLSRVVVVELLAAAGCQSEGVAGGEAALAALERVSYDLVLLDLLMPDVPGWQVARAARQRDPAPIVVLFTGWDVGPDDPLMRESGADLLLQKPIVLTELVAAVGRVVARRAAAR